MRVKTGVPGFDDLLEGGLPKDRLYIVSGPPGSGKTTFCSQFMTQGAREGERGLYLSMHENEPELVADMGRFDFGFESAIDANRVKFLNVFDADTQRLISLPGSDSFQGGITKTTTRLMNFVDANDIDRVVVDSTMLLRYFFADERDAFLQFVSALKRVDATTILVSELTDPTSYADEHYLSHGVIFLHNYLDDGSMRRGIQLVKMRGTDIDCDIHEVSFSPQGLSVAVGRKIEA